MTPLGLAFRFLHYILHLSTAIFIILGILKFPHEKITGALYIKRTLGWLGLEGVYLFVSTLILIYSTISLLCPARIHPKIQKLFAISHTGNLFFYCLGCLFIVYSTMIGCHIPTIFHLNELPSTREADHRRELTWRTMLLIGIGTGVVNATLCLFTAFIDTDKSLGRYEPQFTKDLEDDEEEEPLMKDDSMQPSPSQTSTTPVVAGAEGATPKPQPPEEKNPAKEIKS